MLFGCVSPFYFLSLKVLTGRILKFFADKAKKDPVTYREFYEDYGLFFREGIVTTTEQGACWMLTVLFVLKKFIEYHFKWYEILWISIFYVNFRTWNEACQLWFLLQSKHISCTVYVVFRSLKNYVVIWRMDKVSSSNEVLAQFLIRGHKSSWPEARNRGIELLSTLL